MLPQWRHVVEQSGMPHTLASLQHRRLHAIGGDQRRRVLHARRQAGADDFFSRFFRGGELVIESERAETRGL
jgi:hypothetical protein